MDAALPSRFVPPCPPIPSGELPLLAFLRAIRTNALTMWTDAAYEQDMVVRRFLGRTNVLVNAPDEIHRVLVDNPGNYRRSPASIRILRPITGNGLLLSEGDAWRHQRRTVAPALAPRVMPMLARHIVVTAREHIESIAEHAAQGPIDLLAAMQGLALEIAGRSMFSLEMRAFGAPLRQLLTEFGERFARPFLFDMLLPPSVPTLRDLRRWRFQARWMRLVETIMHDRLREPQPDAPRDLFDLLRAARDPETGEAFSPEQLRDQLATLLLAGHETTAVTLFWSLTLLAQDAKEQGMVAEEVRRVAIEPENATAVLPLLVRTRAVVSEALRLYPPAFTMAREAIGPDRAGRPRPAEARGGADRALGAAPASEAVARTGRVRSVAIHAGRTGGAAVRVSAVRRGAAGVRRRAVRADRGGAGAGDVAAAVRGCAGGCAAGAAGGDRHDAAGPSREVPAACALISLQVVSQFECFNGVGSGNGRPARIRAFPT